MQRCIASKPKALPRLKLASRPPKRCGRAKRYFRLTGAGAVFLCGNNPQTGISDLQGNVWEWTNTDATAGDHAGMKIQPGNSCRGYPGKIRSWNDAARGHEVIGFR